MRRFACLTVALAVFGCGDDDGVSPIQDDELSMEVREDPRTYFFGAPVTADTRWQFLAHEATDEGIRVTLGYEIIFLNSSRIDARVQVDRLTFEDKELNELAVYAPEGGIVADTVSAESGAQFISEAQIDVADFLEANSIRRIVIWARFQQVTGE